MGDGVGGGSGLHLYVMFLRGVLIPFELRLGFSQFGFESAGRAGEGRRGRHSQLKSKQYQEKQNQRRSANSRSHPTHSIRTRNDKRRAPRPLERALLLLQLFHHPTGRPSRQLRGHDRGSARQRDDVGESVCRLVGLRVVALCAAAVVLVQWI